MTLWAGMKISSRVVLLLVVVVGVLWGVSWIEQQQDKGVIFASEKSEGRQAGGAEVNEPAGDSEDGEKGAEACRPDHSHPAFDERHDEREEMVERQIRQRDVRDANVLVAMNTVPRHAFVRSSDLRRAYSDQPLAIGLGQTISQPYIVGYMTEALGLKSDSKVLEVGTGSGYQAAVCAEIAKSVYTVEILDALAKSAGERLEQLGYCNVHVKSGDGYFGWEANGPFDVIIVTAAAGLVPPPLIEQLKPGGRLILPLGSPYGVQTLVLVSKDEDGELSSRRLLPVMFVPMTGRAMEEKP